MLDIDDKSEKQTDKFFFLRNSFTWDPLITNFCLGNEEKCS